MWDGMEMVYSESLVSSPRSEVDMTAPVLSPSSSSSPHAHVSDMGPDPTQRTEAAVNVLDPSHPTDDESFAVWLDMIFDKHKADQKKKREEETKVWVAQCKAQAKWDAVCGKSHQRVPAGSCHFSCLTDPLQSVVNFPCIRK